MSLRGKCLTIIEKKTCLLGISPLVEIIIATMYSIYSIRRWIFGELIDRVLNIKGCLPLESVSKYYKHCKYL